MSEDKDKVRRDADAFKKDLNASRKKALKRIPSQRKR